MEKMHRRHWVARTLALGTLPAVSLIALRALAQPEPQVVKITAKRFVYTPSEFKVKAGQPVVLEFTSVDFVHGFSLPDLNVRADLPPGRVTRVSLPAAKPGVYDFLCDNFCGDGHEEMHGRMIVET
jgi:cytochrome c oxidase subunit 2